MIYETEKKNRVALLLHWAGEQKNLAVSGDFSIGGQRPLHYRPLHWDLPADGRHIQSYLHTGIGCSDRGNDRGSGHFAVCPVWLFRRGGPQRAYGALFKVRCMVAEHMARAPLGALNERRTGDIKTVLNEDIEKLELFLAHNLPDLVCYLVGPVVIFSLSDDS